MALVWLIRHGESEANAGFPTDEQTNIQITEKGHQQAKQVASFFSQQPSLIVTSPFLRTKQTAQTTIDRFSSVAQAEWQVQEFNYLATARRKNTTLAERKPMAEEYWQRNDPFYVDGEGAESFAEMMSRVHSLQMQIQDLQEEFVAIFTHGMFMRAFLWSLIFNSVEATPESMYQVRVSLDFFNIPNGAILNLKTQERNIWLGGVLTTHLFDLTALNNAD
ncbi:histidine phosphatase family protein [Calothrix sp. UHCC 0171]|uniref:histidine phosphatase family protein n=1 Tax=Calothrix sp. UHCC 0171 TaxID=3110245 RepID=UPI002B1FE9BA|nr:histidine phosphatase family protein [Calothrix sp. UHCC 0171]MEA5574298.1 histidine phosphatase family protein [Calothrix sp. UHCC 0171]